MSRDTTIPDEQLAQRVTEGDQRAFTMLYERHRMSIFRFCVLMLGDKAAAKDVYQEAFIALYQACSKGEQIRNVRAYLITVARRRCLNHLRDGQKHVSMESEEIELSYEINTDIMGMDEMLHTVMMQIPDRYRDAFLLFELEGYSYAEIAEQLEVNSTTIRNRIYRAKKALFKILAPLLNTDGNKSTLS